MTKKLLFFGTFLSVLFLTTLSFVAKAQTTAYEDAGLPNPTVTSDKEDYMPGEVAHITGSGWTLDQQVHVEFKESPDYPDFHIYDITVNEDGTWTIDYPIELRHLGVIFTVVATGNTTGYIAQTIFTDANCPNPTISTVANQTVCQGGTAVFTVTASPSGTVSFVWKNNTTTLISGSTTPSGSNISISSTATTSTLTITNTQPGDASSKYVVEVTNSCITVPASTASTKSSNSATLTVTPTPSATISYGGTPYCSTFGNADVTQTGTTGGTYSSTPSGLSINPSSGRVNVGASTPGTYDVKYLIAAAGGCSSYETHASITITQAPSASLSYGGSPYCSTLTTATPTFSGTSGGTFTASPSGLSINGSTGVIDPSASNPNNYTVTYTIAAGGGCAQYQTTASVRITAAPSATISYTGSPYCSNAGMIDVTRTGTAGGSYSGDAGTVINAGSGRVNTGTTTPGTHTITYTIAAANGCEEFKTTTTITVNATPVANLTGANTICNGQSTNLSVNVTVGTGAISGNLSDGLGNLIPFSGTGTGTILVSVSPTTTRTYSISTLTDANCTAQPSGKTGTAMITVDPVSVGGTATADASTICSGTGTTIRLTGITGNVVKWQKSVGGGSFTDIATTAGVTEYSTGNLTETTKFRAVVQSGVCDPANSNEVTITIDPVSVGGTAAADASNVCSGSGTIIRLTGNIGNVVKWQKSVGGGSFTDITSTAGVTEYSTGNLTQTTKFLAVVQSGVCDPANSNEVTISVDPVSVGGTAAADASPVCSGTGTIIRLTGNTGSVVKWQKSVGGGSFTDIASTAGVTEYSTGNLTQATKFRAIVQSGVCDPANSTEVTISIDPVSVGGTATPDASTLCAGTGTIIRLTGNTGNVVKWQKSVGGGSFTDIASTSGVTEYSTGNLTQTTKFRAVVQSGVCDPAYSNEVTVTVNQLPVFVTPATSPTNLGTVDFSDPITSTAITVTDADNTGSQLTLTASYRLNLGTIQSGLPSGLTAPISSTGANSRSWTLSGNINVAPGNYRIKVAVSDGSCEDSTIFNLVVTKEEAIIEYSGLQYFSAATSSPYLAKLTLQATAQESDNDGNLGNLIQNALVNFQSSSALTTFAATQNRPLGEIVSGDKSKGVAIAPAASTALSYTLNGSEVTSGVCITITPTLVSSLYNGTSVPGVITISVPGADNVSGGGFIPASTAAGTAGLGSTGKVNFGFTMKYNKSGSNLQGQANIIFRNAGVNWQIKSNAINTLAVTNYPATGTATGRLASFTTKANLTNLSNGQSTGNLNLTIQAVQSTVTGSPDMILITLTNPTGGLLFSSKWDGTRSVLLPLGGGKINVRGTATTSCCASPSTVDESTRVDIVTPGTFKVRAFPNPTTHLFTIDVQSSSNEPIEVKVFDMMGHMVYYRNGLLKQEHHRFGQMLTDGMYMLHVRQGDKQQTITVIKK